MSDNVNGMKVSSLKLKEKYGIKYPMIFHCNEINFSISSEVSESAGSGSNS